MPDVRPGSRLEGVPLRHTYAEGESFTVTRTQTAALAAMSAKERKKDLSQTSFFLGGTSAKNPSHAECLVLLLPVFRSVRVLSASSFGGPFLGVGGSHPPFLPADLCCCCRGEGDSSTRGLTSLLGHHCFFRPLLLPMTLQPVRGLTSLLGSIVSPADLCCCCCDSSTRGLTSLLGSIVLSTARGC
jgi:hypothetical protein